MNCLNNCIWQVQRFKSIEKAFKCFFHPYMSSVPYCSVRRQSVWFCCIWWAGVHFQWVKSGGKAVECWWITAGGPSVWSWWSGGDSALVLVEWWWWSKCLFVCSDRWVNRRWQQREMEMHLFFQTQTFKRWLGRCIWILRRVFKAANYLKYPAGCLEQVLNRPGKPPFQCGQTNWSATRESRSNLSCF